MKEKDKNFTKILQKFSEGEIQSNDLIPLIYDELHLLARIQRKKFSSA
jgi:hypothetical protein